MVCADVVVEKYVLAMFHCLGPYSLSHSMISQGSLQNRLRVILIKSHQQIFLSSSVESRALNWIEPKKIMEGGPAF